MASTQAEVAMQHCLPARLYSYPLVKATVDRLSDGYSYGKTYRGVGPLLGLAETSIATAAATMQPIVHRIDKQVLSAEKLACGYLDVIDEKYPAVKSEPAEVVEAAKTYYNDSRLKSGVDYTVQTATKVYGMPQVAQAYYEQKKAQAITTVHNTVDVTIATMTAQIHGLLDVAEATLDRLVAGSSGVDGNKGDIKERITSIAGRAAVGMKAGIVGTVDNIKGMTNNAMQNLYQASILLDYIKARQEWAKETMLSLKAETINVIGATRQRVIDFGSKLRSVDDVQREVHKAALGQMDRLQQAFHAFLDYVNERVIPASPDNGAAAGTFSTPAGGKDQPDEPESRKSSTSADESGEESASFEESFD